LTAWRSCFPWNAEWSYFPLSPETPRWVLVARILRARGNKGEVAAEILTDFPERLTRLREVFVGHADDGKNEPRRVSLKACWLSQNHRGQAVFHLEDVNSISEAEKFRGLDVLLPFEQRVTLPAGQYFVSDLIGCSVFENPTSPSMVSSSPCSLAEAPSLLGTVTDVQTPGEGISGTPLLEVETSSRPELRIAHLASGSAAALRHACHSVAGATGR
jgi:16S rRNA processing protein RimM